MLVSSFNNFRWTRIIENGDTVMEINDVFFTQVFNAVSGGKSCYSKYFDEFAIKFKIGYYLPWLSNTSQIICHINFLDNCNQERDTINFKNRLPSTLRWRLLDALSRNKSCTNLKSKWMCCLQELVGYVYNYLTNGITLLDKIDQVNKKYILDIIPLKILALFRGDVEMFAVMLKNNCERQMYYICLHARHPRFAGMPERNSRKNILKKRKELEQENITTIEMQLDLDTALKDNPQKFVQYM